MKKIALFFALLTLYPQQATAASLQPEKLPRVVVTASRIEEKTTSITQAVTLISAEEISKNQHKDFSGLLRQHGIQVNSFTPNSSLSQTRIRGLATDLTGGELQGQVLILVDGRRVGTGLVGLVPMVNIERIEILRGPGAVQYGTSAMGGVVNIITRRGTDETHGMAEFGAGSFETFRSQGEVAGYFKGFDYSLGTSFLTAGDYKTGSGWLYENSAVGRNVGYNANIGYNFLEEHRLGLTALGIDAVDLGSPNDVRAHDLTAHNNRYNYSFDMNYEGGAKDYGLDWKTRYVVGRGNYENWEPTSMWATFYQLRTEYQGTQGQLSFSKSFITLTGGMDWNEYDFVDSVNGDSNYNNNGYFMLAKLAFIDDLIIISGGIRYDDYRIKIGSNKDNLDHTTPTAGLALNPTGWLALRANYGESYIVPSAQQFLGFKSTWGDYLGDPDLDPETGKGWDAGLDVHYKALNFVFTYFQTDYENKITTRPVGPDHQYYNVSGKAKYRGIETAASLDIGALMDCPFVLKPYINLTHLLKYDDSSGKALNNVSDMDIAYGLGFYHPDWGLDVDLRFIYFGKQKVNDYDPATSVTSKDTLGDITTADLYISKTFYSSAELGTFSVKAEFKNLFDKDYYMVKEFPMPGRSYWLGLRYDY